jgi:hypothetical protein
MSREPKRMAQPGFGKRGRPEAPAERRPTAVERLKKIGARWWGKKKPQNRKDPRGGPGTKKAPLG